MIIPVCPMCGHDMYFLGDVSVLGTPVRRRYACVHCDHIEEILLTTNHKDEFIG